jgi:hypothetical protein
MYVKKIESIITISFWLLKSPSRTNVMGLENLHSDIQDEDNDIFSAYCFLYLKMPQSDGLEIIYLKILYLYSHAFKKWNTYLQIHVI